MAKGCFITPQELIDLNIDGKIFREFINGDAGAENLNRNGVDVQTLLTWKDQFQQFLLDSGYQDIGDYGPGLVITARNQIFWREGELYRAGAALELPYTTTGDWGAEGGSFVAVGDAALRQQLADPVDPHNGAGMVAFRGDETVRDALSKIYAQPVFGRSGLRVTVGVEYDAHYGWGGIVVMPNGLWAQVYRKATHHGIRNGSELRIMFSADEGANWFDDRLVCPSGPYDLRPQEPRMLANGRVGFLVNRQSEGAGHYSPWFVYSDDNCATFVINEITTSSPYTFSGHSGLIDWPASQGGDDVQGFCSFGYLSAGGLDLLGTQDNGNTWTMIYNVALPGGDVTSISETTVIRLGDTDRWLMFSRAQDGSGWRQMLTAWATTDLRNWGAPGDAGLQLGGNPPGGLYDPRTNTVHLLNTARGGRPIDGFEQHLMHAVADADALWGTRGDFAALGATYKVLTPIPHWNTGYLAPFFFKGSWWTTITCGEPGTSGGSKAIQVLLGDFVPSGRDVAIMTSFFIKRQKAVGLVEMVADDNLATTRTGLLKNQSGTVSLRYGPYGVAGEMGGAVYTVDFGPINMRGRSFFGTRDEAYPDADAAVTISSGSISVTNLTSVVGSASARAHVNWVNVVNGIVGTVSTSGNATAYNTSSDELLKIFQGLYSGDDAIAIIKADPVRRFNWKNDPQGRVDVGWGAQTSYSVSPDLATPGGWLDADGNEVAPETEGARYAPWGVDQSKRTPYLWAALARVIERLEALEAREP